MRVAPNQLQAHLQKSLAPVYLLSGDEPLQMSEAADSIRHQAQSCGYSGREILEVDARFDWSQLRAEADSLSLFAEQRIIDLRIPSGKPGNEGSKALNEYATRLPNDVLLLITLPKLEKSQSASKWFKALDKVGVAVQIWPVDSGRLQPWIAQRMRSAGLSPAAEVVPMLAERIEGNMLAARQEIEKLLLLYGPGVITPEQLAESVADSARYDVFALIDAALGGKISRCLRMLNGLQAEGTPEPVVLWALTRELRLLVSLAGEISAGRSAQQAVTARREVWEKRKPLVIKGLQRLKPQEWRQLLQLCGRTDRAIKGREQSDPWLLMRYIVARMAGAPAIG
jgi:DNA polymerase III subunit delta